MANKTIPQLPEQTGITDNDVLAIVDSGETTTSKIKVSTLLDAVPAGVYESGNGLNSIKPVAGTNTASNQYSVVINGNNNTSTDIYSISSGLNNDSTGDYSAVIGGRDNNATGKDSAILSSEFGNVSNAGTVIGGWGTYVYANSTNPDKGGIIIYSPSSYIRQNNGSGTTTIKGENQAIIASRSSEINGQNGNQTIRSVIIASNDTDITGGTTNTLMLGCSGRTATNSHTTYVETLEAFTHVVLNDYSNLNFASDSAAATGGVPLGGIYHNSGDLKVRTT